jgi:hypothetical protein
MHIDLINLIINSTDMLNFIKVYFRFFSMESHGKMVRPNGQEIVGFNMNFYNLRKKLFFISLT